MSRFLTPLREQNNLNGTWTLIGELVYESTLKGIITAPEGFVTDYASTPRIIWWLMPKAGEKYDAAAVIHDYLYRHNTYPQIECDQVFREAMLASGVRSLRAATMYRALRLFGWVAYNNQPKEKKL